MHHLASRLWLSLLAFTMLSFAFVESAWARVDVCYSGGQFLPNFTLNGDGFLNGTSILVTRAVGNQRASVMYDTPLSTSGDIHIRFVVRISQSGVGGADGMAFVMHNASTGVNAIGTAGGGVGYDGISPAVVVEFDTYENGWDANANHVAITRGSADHTVASNSGLPVVTNPPVTLKSGSNIYVWIDYVASTHTLRVYLSATSTKPGTATLSTTSVNVATLLGSQMYIGFTGSTGGSWNQHEIVELYASDTANPGDACCNVNADCVGRTAPLGTVCDPVKKVCGPCSLIDDGTCPQPAGCNVSAALNVCTTECAGDYGTGATNACVTSNFRACSTTGTTSGNCVMCNGDYTAGSGLSVRCPSGAPTCLDDGFCGSCRSNADCTTGYGHAGGICNTTTGRCYCGTNADCSGASAGPTCTAGTCGCTADAQCGTGNFCSNAVCKPRLTNGTAIPADTLHGGLCNATNATAVCQSAQCNTATNSCSGPNTTTDCTLARQCTSNICGSNFKCGTVDFSGPCASGSVCQSGICSSGGNVCLATNSCWVDADCPTTEHCDRNARSCATDLTAGSALPNDGYHLGTCSDAAAVCATSACNAAASTCAAANGAICNDPAQCVIDICGSNGRCGIADYDGTCSTVDASTLCQSGACSAGNVCMASTACYVDGDCLATQYCNRTDHTCSSRLLAGADIPSDGLHDGSCLASPAVCAAGLGCNGVQTTCGASNGVTCSTLEECVANVCGSNSLCGFADGTGECNSSNAASLCQSSTCSANVGICIPAVNGCAADDDCAIGSYCDGLTLTCQPRLSAGASLPTDGIHDGSCTVASRVCEAGLTCNPRALTCGKPLSGTCASSDQCAVDICGNNGLCGLAALQGSCTLQNATTLCQSGFCGSTSGVCVANANGCGSDADCSSTAYCNGSTYQCVMRLVNGTPIPADGLHDGSCGISETSPVCGSGQCNPATDTCAGPNGFDCNSAADCVVDHCGSNQKCGLADGQSGCTATDGLKICQSAECAPSGTCVPTDGCYIDSDCSAAQYCDRITLMCHGKLAKGEPIPTDGLHLGDCSDAANVCDSGLCNAERSTCAVANGTDCGANAQCVIDICGANGKCGIANGSPGCTPATGATLCQSSTCPASGVCIPANTFCWVDSDCSPQQFCNRGTNQCLADLVAGIALPNDGLHNGQCTVGLASAVCVTGLCNGTTSTCASANNVSCVVAAECESGICGSNKLCGQINGQGPCSEAAADLCQSATCGTSSDLCVPAQNGCASDADCGMTQYCNATTFTCAARLPNGANLPKDALHNGQCTAQLAAIVCASAICNDVTNTCAAPNGAICTAAAQCQNDYCGSNSLCGRANHETGCTKATQGLDCQSGNCSSNSVCIPPQGCATSGECRTDQYCDTVTLTCVTKLIPGTPVPAGTCTQETAAEYCVSGACNPTTGTCAVKNGEACQTAADCTSGICGDNHLCGIANGDGPCTDANAHLCQSSECGPASRACVPDDKGCNVDADCAATEYCNVTTHACSAKQIPGETLPTDDEHDGDCSTELAAAVCSSAACNPVTNTCAVKNEEACGSAKDCVSNYCGSNGKCGLAIGDTGCTDANESAVCQSGDCSQSGRCVPKGGCAVSEDCPSGSYCDATSGECKVKAQAGDPIPTETEQCTASSASTVCATGECNAQTDTCANPIGKTCEKGRDCVSNYCGSNGRCAEKESCTTEHCLEGDAGFVGGGGCTTIRGGSQTNAWAAVLVLSGLLGWRRRHGLAVTKRAA
jgi:hypothetical protein